MTRTTRPRRTAVSLGLLLSPLLAAAGCGAHSPVRAAAVLAPSPIALAAEHAPVEPAPVRTYATDGALPLGDLPGWRQVLAEGFDGTALPRGWGAYRGAPGGNAHGWWEPCRVAVRDGSLRLTGAWDDHGTYTTGGVMAWGARTTYGKYEVRFRVSRAAGASYALLLWPSSGTWPAAGEVDFAEDGGGDRTSTTATLHSGPSHRTVQRSVRADFSGWQTVGVEWTPGRLVYTLDGTPWATMTGADVPNGPMDLALQLEAGRGTAHAPAPTAATPTSVLEVDWAVAYERAA